MQRLKKGLSFFLWFIFFLVVITAGSGYALFRSSAVQTFVAQKLASYFSNKINATVTLSEIDVAFPTLILVKNIYVSDQHKDTLLFAKQLSVDISNTVNANRRFELQSISLYDGRFKLIQYPKEEDLNVQFLIDAFDTGPGIKNAKPFVNLIRKLKLHNINFSYQYLEGLEHTKIINFSDIYAANLSADADSLEIIKDTIAFNLKSLSTYEKCGLHVKQFKAKTRISPSFVEFKNMYCQLPESELTGDFSFLTESYNDFKDFETKVKMKGNFQKSFLQLGDLAYFADEMEGISKKIELQGKISGTQANLKGRNLDISFGKKSRFKGNVSMKGLPNWENTFTILDIESFETNLKDLQEIPQYPFTSDKFLALPKEIGYMGTMIYSGSFTGFESDFVSYGDLKTDIGKISLDIEMKTEDKSGLAVYKGKIKTEEFNLGKYFQLEEYVGKLSLNLDIDGRGLKQNNVNTLVKGNVSALDFNNYIYHNIKVDGNFAKNIFSGIFSIYDDNIQMDFNGDIDLRNDLPHFDFEADLKKANLTNLNFVSTKQKLIFSSKIDAEITGDNLDNLEGKITLNHTIETHKTQGLLINKIFVESKIEENSRIISFDSDIAKGKIYGDFMFGGLKESMQSLLSKNFPSYFTPPNKTYFNNLVCIDIETLNSAPITKTFFSGLVIMPGTKITGRFNSKTQEININSTAKELIIGGYSFKKFALDIHPEKNVIKNYSLNINSQKINISDSSYIENFEIISSLYSDSLGMNINWNKNSTEKNKADINAYLKFNSGNIQAKVLENTIYVYDSLWVIDSKNSFTIDSVGVFCNNVNASFSNQIISLQTEKDYLGRYTQNIEVKNFDVRWFNPILRKTGTSIAGRMTGKGNFSTADNNLIFSSGLGLIDFSINNELFGNASLIAVYNNERESIAINAKFMRGEMPSLTIAGFYYPNIDENSLDLEITLNQFPIKNIEGYTKGVFSGLKGLASGSIILSGTSQEPVLKGEIEIVRGAFIVDYLNVAYSFSNKVFFKENEIYFNDLTLFDPSGNMAVANGKIEHDYFDKFNFNIKIDVKKLMVFNTVAKGNDIFYGKAFASGFANIHGDLSNMIFDITAKSEKGTMINIPLYGSEEVVENSYITFVEKDSTKFKLKKNTQIDLSDIQMNFDLQMTPDAEIQLIFDPTVGDVISGTGDGNLKMNINTLGNFQMYGDYTIRDGKYLLTLQNIINKKFNIENGSTILWNGNPLDAQININAIYKLRAGLSEILQDSSKQRVPVECKLMMSERLMKPNIKFDIQFPNADAGTREKIKSAINFDNELEMNKQVFSLLLLGSFFPSNSGNNALASNGVSSNTNELLSNQISNWISGVSKQVNLGFNYKNDQTSSREVQLTMSKELFNSRLSIDGNFGVRNNSAANNIIGDVNIDYKITNDGKFRVKAFNQSNDYTALLNQAPFTQGLGIYYREDFESFSMLFAKYKNAILLKRLREEREIQRQKAKVNSQDLIN